MSNDHRRAGRIVINVPAVVEPIGQAAVKLHPNLANVYQRVEAVVPHSAERFPAVVRDLSTNGAFVAGDALPLLSRVAIRFHAPKVGDIDAVGWVLWRRQADCEVPGADGNSVVLPKGFGILFEAISLDVRNAIAAVSR